MAGRARKMKNIQSYINHSDANCGYGALKTGKPGIIGARHNLLSRCSVRTLTQTETTIPEDLGMIAKGDAFNSLLGSDAFYPSESTTGINTLSFKSGVEANSDDGVAFLDFTGMDFYFDGNNYGNSKGGVDANDIALLGIYFNTNGAIGFTNPDNGYDYNTDYQDWQGENQPAILFNFYDSLIFNGYESNPTFFQNGNHKRVIIFGKSYQDQGNVETKKYELIFFRDVKYQYIQYNCFKEDVQKTYIPTPGAQEGNGSVICYGYDIANNSNFPLNNPQYFDIGPFGSFNKPGTFSHDGPVTANSYVLRSDLLGNNWKFFPNYHLTAIPQVIAGPTTTTTTTIVPTGPKMPLKKVPKYWGLG